MKIAVQMYSLRDGIKTGEDLLLALGHVRELGFEGVEFAGYYGLDAGTLRTRLDELGLVCVGTHLGLEDMDAPKLKETIEFHKILGCTQIGIGGADTSDEECLQEVLDIMSAASAAAEKEGMKVYYHNHWFEFNVTEDSSVDALVIDRLRDACCLEVDTYWSFLSGVDNYKFLTDNKDRIVAVHIKDGIDRKTKALGEGNCDLDAVIRGAKDIGMEWLIIENDEPEPNGLADVARSIKYLKEKL